LLGVAVLDSWQLIADVSHRFLAETPAKLWFSCFAIGIVVERAFGGPISATGFRGYATNILHGVGYLGTIFILGPALWYYEAALRDAMGMHGLINLDIVDNSTYLNQMIIVLIFLFLVDFFQYWWHRTQHTVPFLWDQHVVHHSDENVNITTAVRHHPSEFIFQSIVIGMPLTTLFKISPDLSSGVGLVFSGLQFYLHSNLRIDLGRFSWVFGSPGMHRIHHSIRVEHQNKNFAAYFPIWDIIFGTYYRPPAPELFPPTGVSGLKLNTVRSLATHTFVMWTWRVCGSLEELARSPLRNVGIEKLASRIVLGSD
jgi:sterol desaturase/sphingolipid hydroxylase (fatty acid hydroxylase superfamily)